MSHEAGMGTVGDGEEERGASHQDCPQQCAWPGRVLLAHTLTKARVTVSALSAGLHSPAPAAPGEGLLVPWPQEAPRGRFLCHRHGKGQDESGQDGAGQGRETG